MNGMEKLLKTASSKLGMSPEKLMNALEKGDMNSVLSNMNPSDKQKIKSVLENGTAVETLMKNPAAAMMMQNMKAGKGS
ncbi:MAG: hypothetical protein FWG70_05900 [Oscillospiraceae bacterium]|nr:hypothetical protein [Oscillospiraceae bacterium]